MGLHLTTFFLEVQPRLRLYVSAFSICFNRKGDGVNSLGINAQLLDSRHQVRGHRTRKYPVVHFMEILGAWLVENFECLSINFGLRT